MANISANAPSFAKIFESSAKGGMFDEQYSKV
jgi:hypothetical protein